MAVEKNLNTRIILKNDSLANWNSSSVILKTGEIALVKIEAPMSGTEPKVPTYLMKVGDGESAFGSLNWLAANAADVYAWAKKSSLDYADLPETLRTEIDNLQAAVGDGGSVADAIAAAVNALDVDDAAVANQFVTAVKQVDGKIEVSRAALTAADIPALGIDKITDLQAELDELASGISDNADAIDAINNKIGEVTEGKTVVDMIAEAEQSASDANSDLADRVKVIEDDYLTSADKTELANSISALDSELDTEIARAKAAEEANATEIARVNAVLVNALDNNEAGLDSIKELATWINAHGTEATAMAENIQKNADAINDIIDGTTPVAEAAHADVADKVGDLNADDVASKNYVDAAEQDAIDTAAADATAKANAAKNAAIEAAAADATTKADAAKQEAINTAAADATTKADAAKEAAKDYADSLAVNYATAAQGAKADSALQEVEAGVGLKVSAKANNKQTIDIDDSVVFVLNCGTSTTVI